MTRPKTSRTGNLAWGLAAVAVTLVTAVLLAGAATSAWVALREAGVVDALLWHLPPRGEPLLPRDVLGVVGLLSAFGPWFAAGVLVARRERWRVVLVSGAVSAGLFMSVALLADLSVRGVEVALGFGFVSLVAGVVAAVLCAVRQRWEC